MHFFESTYLLVKLADTKEITNFLQDSWVKLGE